MPARENQQLVGFKCDPAFKAEIERAARPLSVSIFVREALIEKLRRMGIKVNAALAEAPSRAGKGGPKKKNIIAFDRAAEDANTLTPQRRGPVNYRNLKKPKP